MRSSEIAGGGSAPQVSGQTNPWSVAKLIGVPVFNAQDDQVGTIADLVMNNHGLVTNVIVSVGDYLGQGVRLVAVPLETIRFPKIPSTTGAAFSVEQKWHPDRAVLNVTKSTLMQIPPFIY
jgi:hypothetical protein